MLAERCLGASWLSMELDQFEYVLLYPVVSELFCFFFTLEVSGLGGTELCLAG